MAVNTTLDAHMFRHTLIQHEEACPAPLPIYMSLPKIHYNIWRREAWRYFAVENPPDQVDLRDENRLLVTERQFANLEESLELATVLLKRAKPLLDQIYYAPVLHDLSGQSRLDASWKPNPEQDVVRDVLPLLEDKYRLCCLPYTSPTEANHLTNTTTVIDKDSGYPSFKIYTGIAQEFLAVAIVNTLASDPAAQSQAVKAMLAVVLIRELAHTLWAFRNLQDLRKQSRFRGRGGHQLPEEPCTGTSYFADLGASVSQFLFGLEISLPRGFVFFPHDESDGKPLPARHLLSKDRLYVDGSKGLEAWIRNDDGFRGRGFKLSKQTIKYFFSLLTWIAAPCEGRELPLLELLLIPEEIDPEETLPSSDDELGIKVSKNMSSKRCERQVKSSHKPRIRGKSEEVWVLIVED